MKRKRKINLWLIFIIFFITILIYFIFFFNFKTITVEPENFNKYFQLYFIKKDIFNLTKNVTQIMKDFPEIKKISLKINIFKSKINIKIETTKIIAKICDKNKCLFLDDSARIIQPKINSFKNLLLINSELQIENNTLLNPEIKNLLALIFEYANWKPLILKKINIYSNFDIGVIDEKNREFLFDPSRNLEEQIKKMEIFLRKKIEGKRIDLRIPQKIFFK
jgi:hypothetical protein